MEQEVPGTGPREPITLQKVQEAQRAAEASNLAFMDSMRASVPEKGQFFTEIGSVSTDDQGVTTDTRALILREGRPHMKLARDGANIDIPSFLTRQTESPKEKRAVITIKGSRIIEVDAADLRNLLYPIPRHMPRKNDGFSYVNETIRVGEKSYRCSKITTDEDEKFLDESLAESIRISREASINAKNKAALDAANEEQKRTNRLSESLNRPVQPPNDNDLDSLWKE